MCIRDRDGTYSVNKLRMPLYTFLVEDGDGVGRVAAYCFVCNECKGTIDAVLKQFATIYDISLVSCVIVDKSLNEIAAVRNVMPNAAIQLCKFHVMQAITRELRKTVCTEELKTKLTSLMRKLTFCKTELTYNECYEQLHTLAPESFVTYFDKNWHKCREMWAGYVTSLVQNMGNTTNNRLESHNQKIKTVLERHMTLHEALRGLLLLQTAAACSVKHNDFVKMMTVPYHVGDHSVTTSLIVKTLTPYAASIVLKEFELAKKKNY